MKWSAQTCTSLWEDQADAVKFDSIIQMNDALGIWNLSMNYRTPIQAKLIFWCFDYIDPFSTRRRVDELCQARAKEKNWKW